MLERSAPRSETMGNRFSGSLVNCPHGTTVRLGEILKRIERRVSVESDVEYSTVGVRWYGKGAFVRDTLSGAKIAGKSQCIVLAGDVIYNKLFAWKGSFAVAGAEVDSKIVSNEFPTYVADLDRVDLRYLSLCFQHQDVARQALAVSSGGSAISRLRLNPKHFVDLTIPLPPLERQRSIAASLGAARDRIDRALDLRRRADAEIEALFRALLRDWAAGEPVLTPMSELVELRSSDVVVEDDRLYRFAGVYSFGRGVFRGPEKLGSEFSYRRLTRVRERDFVYPKLMAWEGALGIVPPECDGLVVSPEFPVFKVDQERVLPDVLDVHFRNPTVWPHLAGASRGTNVRRRRLHPSTFLEYQLPLPSMPAQRRLQSVRRRFADQAQLRIGVERDLEELLPLLLQGAFSITS